MIKYLVDISREYHTELDDAISEARELIVSNVEVTVYKCYIAEDTYNDIYHSERVFEITRYEDGEIEETKYEN